MNHFEVIVSRCAGSRANNNLRSYERLSTTIFTDPEECQKYASAQRESNIGSSMMVLVRPNFNEKDTDCEFFREWQSWYGEEFREIRFYSDPACQEKWSYAGVGALRAQIDMIKNQIDMIKKTARSSGRITPFQLPSIL